MDENSASQSASEDDEALLARIADQVVRRRLAPVAILFLESVKPLNFVGSQLMVFMDPILKLFVTIPDYEKLVKLLEERGGIERLIQAIEAREEDP